MTLARAGPTGSTSLDVIIVDLPGHMVDNRGEVGGSVEAHGFETLVIGLHHALDSIAVWVLWITILHKTRNTNTGMSKELDMTDFIYLA